MLKKTAVPIYNAHKNEEDKEIFNWDFRKVIDVHVLIMFSKCLKVITFLNLNQNNNKSLIDD